LALAVLVAQVAQVDLAVAADLVQVQVAQLDQIHLDKDLTAARDSALNLLAAVVVLEKLVTQMAAQQVATE
jgi:hypothetical protein